ncbi:MAG: phosphatase PAP2 family protein [Spirochaetes bacterium]|nr:phosphatase PAP2 family protein [Spirochaetota bacterium]
MELEIAKYFWSLKESLLFDFFQIISGKPYILITCLIFIVYSFIKIKKKAAIFIIAALLSVAASDILCYRVLKPAIKRQRPAIELNLNKSKQFSDQKELSSRKDYSMPSNHASNIFAFFIVYLCCIKKFWSLLFFNSVLISTSRIILVKHYPSDVIAGIFIGTIIGLIILYLVSLFKLTRGLSCFDKS